MEANGHLPPVCGYHFVASIRWSPKIATERWSCLSDSISALEFLFLILNQSKRNELPLKWTHSKRVRSGAQSWQGWVSKEIEMGKRTSEIQNDFFNYLSPLYLLDHQVTERSLCIIARLTKFKQSKVLQHSESDHQIFWLNLECPRSVLWFGKFPQSTSESMKRIDERNQWVRGGIRKLFPVLVAKIVSVNFTERN